MDSFTLNSPMEKKMVSSYTINSSSLMLEYNKKDNKILLQGKE
ncbi:hypothetical protein [Clostridium sartagoforme]